MRRNHPAAAYVWTPSSCSRRDVRSMVMQAIAAAEASDAQQRAHAACVRKLQAQVGQAGLLVAASQERAAAAERQSDALKQRLAEVSTKRSYNRGSLSGACRLSFHLGCDSWCGRPARSSGGIFQVCKTGMARCAWYSDPIVCAQLDVLPPSQVMKLHCDGTA